MTVRKIILPIKVIERIALILNVTYQPHEKFFQSTIKSGRLWVDLRNFPLKRHRLVVNAIYKHESSCCCEGQGLSETTLHSRVI